MNKKKNPRRRPVNHMDIKRASRMAKNHAIQWCMASIFTAPKDKHGWTNEELQVLWRETDDVADSIAQGYVDINDLISTAAKKCGKRRLKNWHDWNGG